METLKRSWPLFACTAALMATLIACTWSLQITIADEIAYSRDYSSQLSSIDERLRDISRSTDSTYRVLADR